MSKTELTLSLERDIYHAMAKQGVFRCFEVTIGWFGYERVDFMTYDTKGIFRCFEIKSSLADFNSKAKKTFCGHYNYYVLTPELFEKVKERIPLHIGVYVDGRCVKKPKKQELTVDHRILQDSMLRSLCRESDKAYLSGDIRVNANLKKRIRQLEKEREHAKQSYRSLQRKLHQAYGRNWEEQLEQKLNDKGIITL